MTERFRAYNERKLKDWLYHLPDFHEQSYRAHAEEVAETGEGEGDVFSAWVRRVIDDDPPNTRSSHKVLTDAVSYLKEQHWPLYMRLMPVFFSGVESKPWLPDIWDAEAADGSVPDKMAWRDYLEAVIHLMDFVEWRIIQFKRTDKEGWGQPLEKLAVPVPSTVRYRRRNTHKKRRRDALELCQEYRQDLEDHVAIRLAAAQTGYTEKEIRVILRQYDAGKL